MYKIQYRGQELEVRRINVLCGDKRQEITDLWNSLSRMMTLLNIGHDFFDTAVLTPKEKAKVIVERIKEKCWGIVCLDTFTVTIILTAILRGDISHKDVMFNWVDAEGVQQIKPTEDGETGEWRCDYDDLELKLQSEYLDLIGEKQAKRLTS